MENVLVVAVFDEEQAAWDAVVSAAEISAQGSSALHDSCLVVRRPDGTVHVRETNDIAPAKAGWYGGAWGLVAGALIGLPVVAAAAGAGIGVFAARRRDVGITDAFERQVAEKLEPGKAAAVALAEKEAVPKIEAAAERRGAWTTTVALSDSASGSG